MNEKTLKFDNVEVNVKGFHISKQPIALNLVNVNQILTSQKFSQVIQVLNISLATKMIILLDLYALFYLK